MCDALPGPPGAEDTRQLSDGPRTDTSQDVKLSNAVTVSNFPIQNSTSGHLTINLYLHRNYKFRPTTIKTQPFNKNIFCNRIKEKIIIIIIVFKLFIITNINKKIV